MSSTELDTPEIRQARRNAQRLRKAGLSQHEALYHVARKRGFAAWKLFLKAKAREQVRAPAPFPFPPRPAGLGIHYVGSYVPGRLVDQTVRNGDTVTLRIDREYEQVRDVIALAQGRYRGVIRGFEPSFAEEFSGLREEQEIEFAESVIHGCIYGGQRKHKFAFFAA